MHGVVYRAILIMQSEEQDSLINIERTIAVSLLKKRSYHFHLLYF